MKTYALPNGNFAQSAIKAVWAAIVLAFALSAAARADQRAESFVTERANEALTVLNDDTVTLAEKKETFRTLVDDVADVPKITRFVLGRYSRNLDPATMSEFSEVFRSYAIGVYEDRLGDYAGETLQVTGSTERQAGDYVVHSVVSGGGQQDDLEVNWRVLIDDAGVAKVVDVEVYGVWLAINQREEIVGIIQQNRGSVEAAIDALRQRIAEQDAAT